MIFLSVDGFNEQHFGFFKMTNSPSGNKSRNNKSKGQTKEQSTSPQDSASEEPPGLHKGLHEVSDKSPGFDGLKTGWNLFWAGLAGEEDTPDPVSGCALSLDQIKQLIKMLSEDRKKLNQHIETINREIDLNTDRLESLSLVGGNSAPIIEEINQLSDLGMKLSLQIEELNKKLSEFRSQENDLLLQPKANFSDK